MAHIQTKINLYANKQVNFKTEVKLRDDSNGNGIYIYEWNLDIPKPTMAQLDAFEAQANTIEQNEVIKATRKNLYGPLDKQLEEIYDNGIDSWKTRIAQIKTNNPKV
jgi:hypothetical protein